MVIPTYSKSPAKTGVDYRAIGHSMRARVDAVVFHRATEQSIRPRVDAVVSHKAVGQSMLLRADAVVSHKAVGQSGRLRVDVAVSHGAMDQPSMEDKSVKDQSASSHHPRRGVSNKTSAAPDQSVLNHPRLLHQLHQPSSHAGTKESLVIQDH
jgi:hypothetical protein